MATTLPWRMKLPERIPVPGIETKSPVERPGFLFGGWSSREVRRFDSMAHLKEAHLKEPRAISVDLVVKNRFPPSIKADPAVAAARARRPPPAYRSCSTLRKEESFPCRRLASSFS
jgi:hypothetical protein